MEPAPVCPVCQKPMVPDAPQGLCPECLIKSGLETKAGNEQAHGKAAFVPPSVEEIAKLFPQFEIIGLLGQGGMGVVYKARQARLNRFVALKILSPERQKDPQFADRFEREARTLAWLAHPNIVTVYDFGEVEKHYFLLMEFVDGLSLRQLLQARKLSPAEAIGIVPKICEALQYAHEQGVIHRDVKPENILLDKKGQVKIADFGIAKIMDLGPEDLSLTGTKEVVGTPLYMAPEQMETPQTVDRRADIYSLGVVFYEMLTGELPMGNFQPPSQKVQVDVRLDEVVLRALEREPERRYQQASQVKTAVETITGTASSPANEESSIEDEVSKPRQSRRHWVVAAEVAILAMAAIALGLWFGARHQFWRTAMSQAPFVSEATSSTTPNQTALTAHEYPREGLVGLWSGENNGKDSVGANNAILTNVSFTDGKVGRAFLFDGASSFAKTVSTSSLDMENSPGVTVAAWINPNDVRGVRSIVAWYSQTTLQFGNGCILRLGENAQSEGELEAVVNDLAGKHHWLRSSANSIGPGVFQHVAFTYDQMSGVGVLYANGAVMAQALWKAFPPKTKGDVWVGYKPSSRVSDGTNSYFSGTIDEVAIYNRALSHAEIRAMSGLKP